MTDKVAGPDGSELSEGLGLLPEREGQPRTLTVTGPVPEAGHWYSPMEVRALLAAERERCARLCEAQRDEPASREWNMAVKCCVAALRA